MYLLGEELRRIPVSFEHKATDWVRKAQAAYDDARLSEHSDRTVDGYVSYAFTQGLVYQRLATSARKHYAEAKVMPRVRKQRPAADATQPERPPEAHNDVEMEDA